MSITIITWSKSGGIDFPLSIELLHHYLLLLVVGGAKEGFILLFINPEDQTADGIMHLVGQFRIGIPSHRGRRISAQFVIEWTESAINYGNHSFTRINSSAEEILLRMAGGIMIFIMVDHHQSGGGGGKEANIGFSDQQTDNFNWFAGWSQVERKLEPPILGSCNSSQRRSVIITIIGK